MTGKVKIIIGALIVALIGGLGLWTGWSISQKICGRASLEKEIALERRERQRAESRALALQHRLAALAESKQSPPVQKSVWKDRRSGKGSESSPSDCVICLENYRREVEVRDSVHGWWIYRDPDVLDEKPGELELTNRFYNENIVEPAGRIENQNVPEAGAGKPATLEPGTMASRSWSLAPPEKSIRAGVGLTSYNMEFSYSPLVFQGRRTSVAAGISSNLSLDRADGALFGDVSAGFEVRW